MHTDPKTTWRFLIRFYFPVALSIGCLILAFTTTDISPGSRVGEFLHNLKMPAMGLDIPVGNLLPEIYLFRIAAIVASMALLAYALFIDASSYFPSDLKFDIFYDVDGIRSKLRELNLKHVKGIPILANWEDRLIHYDELIVKSLAQRMKGDEKRLALIPQAKHLRESITGMGTSTVSVKRIGLMHYKFDDSSGRTHFAVSPEKTDKLDFVMEFHLKQSPASHIRIRLADLFPFPRIEIKPEYKQALSIDGFYDNGSYDHALKVWSRISVSPVPTYSDSIYLYEIEGEGYIPIGYCAYQRKPTV